MLGAKGEEYIDDSVLVVKTHYPWIPPSPTQYYSNMMLVVTRNPLDSIVSWMHYLMMANHVTKLPFDCSREYPGFFQWWVNDIVPKMRQQYMTYIEEARSKKCPILFVRFEDLILNTKPQLENVARFIFKMADVAGTNVQRRIDQIMTDIEKDYAKT